MIVPTYDRVALLRRTLDALTRQDLGPDDFEVLVVDDGSSDGTDLLVREYRKRLRLRYFFQPDEGFRVATARNVGITNADADVCVFIDSGVLAHSGCLRAHLGSHRGDRPVAVVGYVYCFNHGDDDAAQMIETLDFDDADATIGRLRREDRWLDVRERFYARYDDLLHDLPAPWLMFWTCNASASTAQLRAVGGFDEAFRTWGGEDIDMAYRLHLDGARFVLDRAASAIHYPHEKSREDNNRSGRSNYRYIARKYDTPVSRLFLSDPPLEFFALNDIIRERGLPDCVDHLRAEGRLADVRAGRVPPSVNMTTSGCGAGGRQ